MKTKLKLKTKPLKLKLQVLVLTDLDSSKLPREFLDKIPGTWNLEVKPINGLNAEAFDRIIVDLDNLDQKDTETFLEYLSSWSQDVKVISKDWNRLKFYKPWVDQVYSGWDNFIERLFLT